eukprot:jgi/Ulvmu1/2006/UM012_0169.1
MRSCQHLIASCGALPRLCRLSFAILAGTALLWTPLYAVDVDDTCLVGLDDALAIGAARDSSRFTTDGCTGAAANTICALEPRAGQCADEPACMTIVDTGADCTALQQSTSCCTMAMEKSCADCAPVATQCVQGCHNMAPVQLAGALGAPDACAFDCGTDGSSAAAAAVPLHAWLLAAALAAIIAAAA